MQVRTILIGWAAGSALTIVTSLPATATPSWERLGPEGGVVTALAAAPSRPALLYAGLTTGGIYKSLDRGRTWAYAGAGLGHGNSVDSLAVDPRAPGIAWAGTQTGLFGTTDGGGTWSRVGPPVRGSDGRHVPAVAAHPRLSGVVWSAVFGGRLLTTRNGGASWSLPAGAPTKVSALVYDPLHPSTLYAGTLGDGLFKSTNGGVTWGHLGGGLPEPLYVQSVAVDPRHPGNLFVGLQSQLLYRSADGGATWVRSDNGLPHFPIHSLAVDPGRSSVVYAAVSGNGLFRSLNAGRTWQRLGGLGPFGQIDAVVVATVSAVATSVQLNVSVSGDRGATWQAAHGIKAAILLDLAVSRQSPPRIYALDPFGGILKTATAGASWLHQLPGLANAAVTGPLAIDPADPETLYVGGLGAFGKSINGGRRWTPVPPLGCAHPSALLIDPSNPQALYASGFFSIRTCSQPDGCQMFKSTDGAQSWSCINNGLGLVFARLLGLDPFAPTHLFSTSGGPGGLLRSADGGATWSPFAPAISPSALAFSPVQPGLVFATVLNGLGRSEDGGATWEVHRTGIPEGEIPGPIATDPVDPDRLYVATAVDVYRSEDGGLTWASAGSGLADVFVNDLEIDPEDPSILYVSTYGAGLMRLRQE